MQAIGQLFFKKNEFSFNSHRILALFMAFFAHKVSLFNGAA